MWATSPSCRRALHALMAKLKTFPDRDEDIKRLGLLQEEEFIEEVGEGAGRTRSSTVRGESGRYHWEAREEVDTIPGRRGLSTWPSSGWCGTSCRPSTKRRVRGRTARPNEFLEDFFYVPGGHHHGLKTVIHVTFDILSVAQAQHRQGGGHSEALCGPDRRHNRRHPVDVRH